MTKLRHFNKCNNLDEDKINTLNCYRKNYPWSLKTYSVSNVKNVYFIISDGSIVGFVEVEYNNLNFELTGEAYIYLHEIHISPSMQGKSIGFDVMNLLLDKIPLIEFVVVNKNSGMNKLVNKFKILHCYEAESTTTFRIGKN